MLRRVFCAINLPQKAQEELSLWQKVWSDLPATWTKKENLHITLLFLGNKSEKELEEIKEKVRKIAQEHKTFSIQLTQIAWGPNAQNPRMIWAKGKENKELQTLHKDIEKALLVVPDKTPFSLHVTLTRVKQWQLQQIEPEEMPTIQEDVFLEIPVESIDIMESKLKQKGPEYHLIQSVSLAT